MAYDPNEISTDPVVLRERLRVLLANGAAVAATGFKTRGEAKAACRYGQKVKEIHGLAGFYVE